VVAPTQAAPDHVRVTASLEAPLAPGKTVWVAIRQDIAPGWHSYWRNPGEAGLATTLTWTLPAGVKAGEIVWPTPALFGEGGVTNYGYTKEVTLLVPLTADALAKTGIAKLTVNLLACEHVCVPQQTTLALNLSKASGSPALFAAARHVLPLSYTGTAQFSQQGHALALTLEDPILTGVAANRIQVFPATPGLVADGSVPKISLDGARLVWRVQTPDGIKSVPAFAGVLAIAGQGYAFAATPVLATAAPANAMGLQTAIALAFVGGLILNLMPCVLPILSMKALSLARTGSDTIAARQEGLFYLGGVMATFAAMAGLLLALKASGAALGWGFQLQSPFVVLALALLMAGIGLNLFGVFELPVGFAGAGESLTRRGGGIGAFFTGALAVVVASPCTAPFMGAALGFALTQSVWSAAAVFLALGFGFGLPFAALSASPALIRLIPKPGLWMNRFRQALAFPMFATALWLLWVLGRQGGSDAVIIALATGLAVVTLVWLLSMLRGVWLWVIALAGLAAVLVSASFVAVATPRQTLWAPWSVQAVETARRSGHPVLVDFSASWCVTCLVNERVALSNDAVLARLQQDHVVTLKGDWTSPDPVITAALHDHGRDGVPLYLLYSPDGHVTELPQILTPALVIAALAQVEASPR
jgi:thiol:disulfide interchange protein DsbD